MKTYRQGDIQIHAVDAMPEGLTPVAGEHGRNILARGEATGHHHSVAVAESELYTDSQGTLWLRVKQDTPLEHQEHAAISLPSGDYRIDQQREYTPEAIRNVID